MLGTLLKYENKEMARIMLPLFGAMLAAGLLAGLTGSFDNNIMIAVTGMLFVLVLLAAAVVALIMVVNRFYTHLLGREGYLMFQIPASVHAQILNKAITAVIWIVLTLLVGIVSVGFTMMIGLGAHGFHDMFHQGLLYLNEYGASFNTVVMVIAELIAVAALVLQIYASIMIGHQAQNHKGLCAVGAFIAIGILESVVSSIAEKIIAAPTQVTIDTFDLMFGMDEVVQTANNMFLLNMFLSIAECAIFYFIAWYLMKNRLNLE